MLRKVPMQNTPLFCADFFRHATLATEANTQVVGLSPTSMLHVFEIQKLSCRLWHEVSYMIVLFTYIFLLVTTIIILSLLLRLPGR